MEDYMKVSKFLVQVVISVLTLGVFAGPAIAAPVSAAAATVSAPSTVTINYVPGYGIAMWNTYESGRTVVGNVLPHGSQWKVFKAVSVDGQTWYNLGGNQWISAQYTLDNAPSGSESTDTVNGSVTVNYVPNASIAVWNTYTDGRQVTGKFLPNGTSWRTAKKVTYNGQTWYNVGGNQWLQGKYVTFTDYADNQVLGVPFINQNTNGAPMGCEAASALEAMHYRGKHLDMTLVDLVKTMPIAADNNPAHGFAGSPYSRTPGVMQTILPSAFDPWISQYATIKDISGASLDDIIGQIQAGNPVEAWVTSRLETPQYANYSWGQGVSNIHVVIVDGYNKNTAQVHVSDPVSGQYWASYQTFENAYAPFQKAVAFL
ncbi:hypothetical protein FC34_GL001223 [Lacticaseibacillus brantae DSM 23927]|uniref:Peptidase C39-like domain-containing protein n=2 Tax=Lacticaseibacillus brantae TaxID=943673 RepID=A0A0R2AXY6_9LACO|nr:hypothetical protein FC34_GL001223 [Lacticaseibacillus brantae DSM 23927]